MPSLKADGSVSEGYNKFFQSDLNSDQPPVPKRPMKKEHKYAKSVKNANFLTRMYTMMNSRQDLFDVTSSTNSGMLNNNPIIQ